LRTGDELGEFLDCGRLKRAQIRKQLPPVRRSPQYAKRAFERVYFRSRDSAALQAHEIDRTSAAGRAVADYERQRILSDFAAATDHGQPPDAAELMNGNRPGNESAIANRDTPGEQTRIGEDDIVADPAVVADVTKRHEKVSVSDSRCRAFCAAAMDGDSFANDIVVSDFNEAHTGLEFEILRLSADHHGFRDAVAAAEPRMPFDHGVRGDVGAVADDYVFLDDGVGSDLDFAPERGALMNERRGMDASQSF
jgi:hypothetical protein